MNSIRLICLLAIFGFCAPGIFSQLQPADAAGKIKRDIQNKNYADAITTLDQLQKENGRLFRLNNYDYLLARLLEKTGDEAGAAAAYQAVVKRNSLLSEYSLWHLSMLMRAGGNMLLERLYLKQLLAVSADSLLQDAAQLRLAQSYFDSGDLPASITSLKKIKFSSTGSAFIPVSADPISGNLTENNPRVREALVLLGQAFAQSGRISDAREVFARICDRLPNPAAPDDLALAAARALDELDSRQNTAAPATQVEVSESEHLKRALIYQFNRDFAAARSHYNAVVERFPQGQNVPDAMFQIGRGLVQEGLFDDAIPWFERIQIEFPDHAISAEALNQAASAYARTRKTNEAVSRYQKYIAVYPEKENFERAFLNIIDTWRDEAEFTRALEWTEKTQERFSGKTAGAVAIFSRARIHLSQNDWGRALAALEELREQPDLGGIKISGGTNKEEVAFLHAFTLEHLGRFNEAINEYLEIPEGRNGYYGWQATDRLKALAKDPDQGLIITRKLAELRSHAGRAIEQNQPDAARKATQNALRLTDDPATRANLLDILRRAYALLPEYNIGFSLRESKAGRSEIIKEKRRGAEGENLHRALADELLFLELYDEGAPELETALRENRSPAPFRPGLSNGSATNPLGEFPPETAQLLAGLYLKGDLPARSVAYSESLWNKVPDDYLCEIAPREAIEMLYPAPFSGPLLAESNVRGLDPRFVLSIMRQESRFRPDVRSSAAARGLMQFIYSTSDKIAGRLGKTNFSQNELYYPPVAVLFGTQYIKDLFDQFPEQPQAVAASYNGGESNVARWIKRSHSNDPDRYVPEIAYSQSKDYVYKIMANYRIYQLLYYRDLNPLSPAKPQ
ncbi:MAG TPA: tetratricopeptide repeat protein [Pyrinomonadaceae bacterium]|jgi:soluble lytic murein transglycosylase|nr:tetratricopeptide repeat protein [Pyrinomonadaceae bacterium]